MELLDRLAEFADRHDMFPPNGPILTAVSGGADSMCLLAALLELSASKGFSVAAVHFNQQRVYTLRFMTHAEYDRATWKQEL